jgi:hypothetical protein
MTNRQLAIKHLEEIHEHIGSILYLTNTKTLKGKNFRNTIRLFRKFINENISLSILNDGGKVLDYIFREINKDN